MSLPERIRLGSLDIDLASYRLLKDGELIRLTPTEWSLLRELLLHPNQVLTHRTLLKRVWGDEYETELDYVHTYISRLRRKLEQDTANPMLILTEAGIGYRLNGDAIETESSSTPTSTSSTETTSTPRKRYINPLPQHVNERYIGREAQQEQLKRLLLDNSRLVSLYGRAGVGKTALACKVLQDLQRADQFDGMVLLSATSTGISLARILSDFNRLLGDEATQEHQQTLYRITNLLDRLSHGRYVLLLDNLEHLQNPLTNDLTDDDMNTFFKVLLEQGGTLRVLITSRYPLQLPRTVKMMERVVSLEEGLATEDAITLLRNSDSDGLAGLKDAPEAILTELAQRTHGLPRALEATVGILLESPLMTPTDLLDDETLLSTEIDEMFIEGVINTLPDDAVQVMEMVSAFGRSVPVNLLEQFTEPYLEGASLRAILNRLVRAFFLSFNQADQSVSMHPIDRAYCYSRLSEEQRPRFHAEIADLYAASFTDDGHVKSIAGLSVPLAEFGYRVQATQYDRAAALLLELDHEYLSLWGDYAELADNYAQIVDRIADEPLRRRALLRYGEALRRIGKLGEALRCFEQVNTMADIAGDDQSRANALSSMGWANYDTGHFSQAIQYWEHALQIYREIDDRYGEGDLLGGMGWVSYLMGAYEQALDNIQQSFVIFGEMGDQLYRIGMNIGDSGVIRAAQGDYEQAINNLREALSIAQVVNSVNEQSYKGGYLATALLLHGDIEAAEETAQTAVQYDVPANRHFVSAVHGITLARLGRTEEALIAFRNAVRYADNVLRFTSGLYHARYAHALGLAGIRYLNGEDPTDALDDFGLARAMCSTDGVLEHNLRLIEALDQNNQLDSIRHLLQA